MADDHLPDFFDPKPLPNAQDLASEGYPEIWATLTINTVIGLALYLLFEATRNKRSVHGRRLDRTRCVYSSASAAKLVGIMTDLYVIYYCAFQA
jgi:hypothetical protein